MASSARCRTLNAQEQDIVAGGDTVALRFVVEATHEGELLGIAPTGRRVRWDAVDVYRLKDGKISEEWNPRADAQIPSCW